MSQEMPFLVVGLGNPGLRYQRTRHNIGFMVLDELADALGISFKKESRFSGEAAKGRYKDGEIYMLKPMTYMNASGEAIERVMQYYKWNIAQLLVISDDVELPFGTMRLRLSGSHGGHNGLKSITSHLKSDGYKRLKMGVRGANGRGQMDLADYVLATFALDEETKLKDFIQKGREAVFRLMHEEPLSVMNEVNQRTSAGSPAEEEKKNEQGTGKSL